MRSLLLVSGGDPSRWEAALNSQADALIVDLGDRVARSPEAGWVVSSMLDRIRARAPRLHLVVKVGAVRSDRVDSDLDIVMAVAPDAILLPGAVGGTDIQHLAAKLAVREAEHGLVDGTTRIVALVADTARGVLALGTVAGASGRLSGLGWRIEAAGGDAAALNATDRLARALTLVAAAAAEVDAIDAASPGLDLEALARACETARRDGFSAKLATDARHIPVINAA